VPKLFDRIGVDINQKLALEPAVEWAVKHSVPYIDLCLDQTPELLERGSSRLKNAKKKLDAAKHLGAGWIVVHGGYHFGSDKRARMDAAVARIALAARAAEKKKLKLLLENLNPEPEQAEVRYLCNDLEECRYYFERLDSPALGWSFTVNHAHIRPNRIDEFMAGLDLERLGEVRLADCRGTHEEHLRPGEGTIDFPAVFAAIEASGYRGHYMQAFGSLDDMLKGRETLAALATRAGGK